ncbi:MAG: acyltransferase [Ghiorsea sp.]|nr:acyltransferase [Ghiorsea sp.]
MDGVRGMAAFAVALGHLLDTQASGWLHEILIYSDFPIVNLLWNGSAAVALFFVLSGYVLTLGMQKVNCANQRWLLGYLIGRVSRIALPFWGAMLLSWCLIEIFCDFQVLQNISSQWLSHMWFNGDGLYEQLWKQVALILPGTEHRLIPQGWTLTVELQVSLLLPFIFLGMSKRMVLTVVVTLVLGVLLHQTFVFHFLMGMLLGVYGLRITIFLQALLEYQKWLLFLSGLLLLSSTWQPAGKLGEVLFWLLNGTGAVVMIAVGSELKGVVYFFKSRPLSFLGKISYSFYLTHTLIYLTFLAYLSPLFSPTVVILVLMLLALLTASMFHFAVEIPSIHIGKYFRRKIV